MAAYLSHAPEKCPLCESSQLGHFATVDERDYFECAVCRLVHLTPSQRPSPEEERRVYGLHENDPADARYRSFLDRLARPLLAHVARGAQGLDYGCGPGPTLSLMLQERGLAVAIYDPLFAPDAAALGKTYDFITCSEVAEHFFHPGAELCTLNRMLRPGGWLGVMTSARPGPRAFAQWHYARDPTHVSFYSHATMRWIAARFGWSAVLPHRDVVLFHKLHAA